MYSQRVGAGPRQGSSPARTSNTKRDLTQLLKRTVALGAIIGVVFVGLPAFVIWAFETQPVTVLGLALVALVTYIIVKAGRM